MFTLGDIIIISIFTIAVIGYGCLLIWFFNEDYRDKKEKRSINISILVLEVVLIGAMIIGCGFYNTHLESLTKIKVCEDCISRITDGKEGKDKNKWGIAMLETLGEACKKEMEDWPTEELEQAKENLKKHINRAVEIGNQQHHIKKGAKEC